MAFSLPNNPYFSTSPLADVAEFRQNLVSRIFGRPQDYDLSLAPSQSPELLRRSDLLNPQKTLCTPNSLLNSPGWFQHALASSLQMGLLSLPRYMLKDICLPSLPPQPLSMRLPRGVNVHVPFEPSILDVKPKIPNKCISRPEHSRSSSVSDCDSFLLTCRQPAVRPALKRQSERPKANWSSNSIPNPPALVETQDTGTLVPSLIDGEVIMGFNVWGEKRLCLPHLFRFVLHDVDLQIIDKACTKLQIACTTCTPAQLSLLHSRQILPRTVGSCGLIRKSDAERLTKYIRHQSMCLEANNCEENTACRSPFNFHINDDSEVKRASTAGFIKNQRQLSPVSTNVFKSVEIPQVSARLDSGHDENRPESGYKNDMESIVIPVIHECFGRQLGLIYPDMYKEPYSKCIKCVTCCRYFSPEQFVGHTHTVTEVDNLNHWGFDSTNWRCYLRLYTGRRLNVNSGPILSNINTVRDQEIVGKSCPKQPVVGVDAHRRLEEFKIKFAQPIKLPPSLSAALRSVGLCASVAPFPSGTSNSLRSQTSEVSICEQISALIRKTSQSKTQQFLPIRPNKVNDQTITSTSLNPSLNQSSPCNVMLPQLTLRRLWAPNDGRIKLPPPPKLLTSCEIKSLPEKFQTGPPLLLHSHRVVTQDAAHQYDRDFIPNVCLKPFNRVDSKRVARSSSSRRRRHRRPLRKQNEGNSVQNSRSRSCSEYSSGSRSSRTRSSSASSTSSSRCSCNKDAGRCDPSDMRCIQNGRNSVSCSHKSTSPKWSNLSHRTSDFSQSSDSMCVKKSPPLDLSSTTCSRKLLRTRSFSQGASKCGGLRRTSSCPVFCSIREMSYANNIQCSNDVHSRTKAMNLTSAFEPHRTKSTSSQLDKNGTKQRCKAMAAARAAQGAASRTGPGLWARHFINVQNSSGDSMKLPNARQSVPHTIDTHNHPCSNPVNNTPVLVTNPMKNSLPAAVLALEAIWADLVRLINEYTVAVESRSGVDTARQRLFEQFISMQTCYATHIASLMDENHKLHEKLAQTQNQLLHCQPQLQGFLINNNSTSVPIMSMNSVLPPPSSQVSLVVTSSTPVTTYTSQNKFHHFDAAELDNKSSFSRSDDTTMLSNSNNNNTNNHDDNNIGFTRLSRNDFSPLISDPTRIISSINKLKSMNSSDETYLKNNSAPTNCSAHQKHFIISNSIMDPVNSSSKCLSTTSSMLCSNLKRKVDSSNNLEFDRHRSISSSSLPSVQDRLESTICLETLQSSNNASPLEGGRSHCSSTPTASETDSFTRDHIDDQSEEIHHLEFQNPISRVSIQGGDPTESSIWTKSLPSCDKSPILWDKHQTTAKNVDDLITDCVPKHRDTLLLNTEPPNQTIYTHQPKKRRTLSSHASVTTNSNSNNNSININNSNNNKCTM
ncbi:hypothetical protein MN116_006972 [Schistosoma mekongi]|uniref:c-SKI SMAD4-binding domain-containing protein n=1 Tax=Schistosoma mekongi TaxID=38744 RepID=A0AAE2D2U2_SCHME|nr:hypothetical protein MN116_006972 [Schistosoma mekongi]